MSEFNESLKNITTYFNNSESQGLIQMTENISKFTNSLKKSSEHHRRSREKIKNNIR